MTTVAEGDDAQLSRSSPLDDGEEQQMDAEVQNTTGLTRRAFLRSSSLGLAGLAAGSAFLSACEQLGIGDADPPATSGRLFVLSNSAPHVSVIDTATNEVVETADIADFTAWAWNDDNNHFDGQDLWLGMRDPETDETAAIALNLEALEVTDRFDLGLDELTLYIGKADRAGRLHVGKMEAGEVAVIDTEQRELLDIWDVPASGDVVCDADVAVDADGDETFVYPTREGDTLVSIDPASGQTLEIVDTPAGSRPLMLTTSPHDGRIWIQEPGSNTNSVYEPTALELVDRFPSAEGPIVNTFSPDGRYSYVGHSGSPVVQVVDTSTLEEVTRITVGTNPTKIAVHPDGRWIYPIVTDEAAVAVVDTDDWSVADRVPLGTDPTGIFIVHDS